MHVVTAPILSSACLGVFNYNLAKYYKLIMFWSHSGSMHVATHSCMFLHCIGNLSYSATGGWLHSLFKAMITGSYLNH